MIKNLPLKLKELRQQYHLSQKEVANKINVSPSVISAYETGERTPSLDVLLSLSYLYKCSTDYLLGKSNDIPDVMLDTSGLKEDQILAIQTLIDTIKHG